MYTTNKQKKVPFWFCFFREVLDLTFFFFKSYELASVVYSHGLSFLVFDRLLVAVFLNGAKERTRR